MKWLLCLGIVIVLMHEITCPPVQPDVKPVEGDSPDDTDGDEEGFGLEYDRYLKEIVMALEEDESFRKKLEEMNMTDIKSGKIAAHLDLVSHQIRERLDEIKRQEINRLRMLAKEKMKQMNGIQRMDEGYLHHVDLKNPHSFESKDLEKLIKKATDDLDELDKKRRGEFKQYEMEKEHQRREELKNLDEEKRKAREEEYDRLKKRHEDHPKLHHPGSKDQLEDVWEKTDHMEGNDFNPKTFFKMHDLDGNGFLDQEEVEALFQKELDQVYDPNMPEDDMRERYEDMARMREHVFSELDSDKDRLISMDEFLNYTASQEFKQDDGWKTVDEEQNFTDEEYQRYEEMLREHEERMRAQGYDPNMAQPGMVPVGHDPNVQHMQMPQGMPPQGMNQQHLNQQQQLNQHEQMRQMGQMPQGQMHGDQLQLGQGQMPGGQQGQMPGGHPGMGQGQMHGGQPNMGQGQMHGGQPNMGQGQMHGGQPNMGQGGQPNMGHGGQPNIGQGQMHGGQPNMGQGGQPNMGPGGQPNMGQGQMHGGQPNMGHGGMPNMPGGHPNMEGSPMMNGMPQMPMQGHMPPEHAPMGQGDQNIENVPAEQGAPVPAEEVQGQGVPGGLQNNEGQIIQEAQQGVQVDPQNGEVNNQINNAQVGEVPQVVQNINVDQQINAEPQNAGEVNKENIVLEAENNNIVLEEENKNIIPEVKDENVDNAVPDNVHLPRN